MRAASVVLKSIAAGKLLEGITGELRPIICDQCVWNTVSGKLGLAHFDYDITLCSGIYNIPRWKGSCRVQAARHEIVYPCEPHVRALLACYFTILPCEV